MSCRRFRDELLLYAYGELEPTQVERVESHVAACAPCRRELELGRFAAMGAHAQPAPPPANLSTERLRRAILSEELKDARPNWVFRLGFAGAAAAAILAVYVAVDLNTPKTVTTGGALQAAAGPPNKDTSIPDAAPLANRVEPAPAPKAHPAVTFSKSSPKRITRRTGRPQAAAAERHDVGELLALASDAARSAANGLAEPVVSAPSEERKSAGSDVIVIQPGSGGSATESRNPNGISIGG